MIKNFPKKPHWIILGPEQNWKISFQQGGIWGAKEMLYPEWKALEKGDVLFFYITKTVKGIVGIGRMENKFIQDKPFWPEEIEAGKVVYPFRFEFHIDYLLEEKDWKSKKIPIGLSIQEMRRGINILQKKTVDKLYRDFQEKFNFTIPIFQKEELKMDMDKIDKKEIIEPSNHNELQELIFQIGQLNRLISEKEYLMENERLDVVWRRVERSVPTYVFEVQIGGDIYHALGKLKHAFDLWNSNTFLIIHEKDIEKADALLNGTFHEMKERIKIITPQKVSELYQQKKRWVDLEKEIGLL
jgi:predicted RNA-binding protein